LYFSYCLFFYSRLGLPLAPAFASSAIKRLQTSLALLPTRQLAQTLWSFAAIGYAPLAPQLQAYQQRVRQAGGGGSNAGAMQGRWVNNAGSGVGGISLRHMAHYGLSLRLCLLSAHNNCAKFIFSDVACPVLGNLV